LYGSSVLGEEQMTCRNVIFLAFCFFLIILTLFSGCASLNSESITVNKNQNSGQNAVLTSNGKSIEVNLVKSIIVSKNPNSQLNEFIFEVKNTGESGYMLNYLLDADGVSYDAWLEDYGGFRHDLMVGEFEQLADNSYKPKGNAILKLYPNEKKLIGGLILIPIDDFDKMNVKTILHFSFGGKSQRTWDVTSFFTR
jgi:hypothetical protein